MEWLCSLRKSSPSTHPKAICIIFKILPHIPSWVTLIFLVLIVLFLPSSRNTLE